MYIWLIIVDFIFAIIAFVRNVAFGPLVYIILHLLLFFIFLDNICLSESNKGRFWTPDFATQKSRNYPLYQIFWHA